MDSWDELWADPAIKAQELAVKQDLVDRLKNDKTYQEMKEQLKGSFTFLASFGRLIGSILANAIEHSS